MKNTPVFAWNALIEYYEKEIKNEYPAIKFRYDKKDKFINCFIDEYKEIKNKYMDESVEYLDRHKQAAILVASVIKNDLIYTQEKVSDDKLFIGLEQTALLLGLSYLKDNLNELLLDKKQPTIQKFFFPQAMSCETKYLDILARDLYFQNHRDESVYILSLSHILFLVEFITLKENNIDTNILKEY